MHSTVPRMENENEYIQNIPSGATSPEGNIG